jgi:hypothetical protein
MALKPEKKVYAPPLSEDVYCGVCYAIIDLGKQYSEKYKKLSHRIMIIWEITGETIEIDGNAEPRVISKEYSLTWGDKSELKKLSDSLFGNNAYTDDTFEAKIILGKACQLDITIQEKEDGTKYNKLANIIKLAKGQKAHDPKELLYYEIGDDGTHDIFDKIPEWIRDKIKQSVDFENTVDIPPENKVPF